MDLKIPLCNQIRPKLRQTQPQFRTNARYFSNKIHAHMRTIKEEIEKLELQTAENKLAALSLETDKTRAQTKAQIYSKLGPQLTVLNVALEISLRKLNHEQMKNEISVVAERNKQTLNTLEELFTYKQHLENCSAKVLEELQASIEIQQMKEAVSLSKNSNEKDFFRQKRHKLLSQLDYLILQKDGLLRECSPELLVRAVKEDKEAIRRLKAERKTLKRTLEELKAQDAAMVSALEDGEWEQITGNVDEILRVLRLKEVKIRECLDYLLVVGNKFADYDEVCNKIPAEVTPEGFAAYSKKLQAFKDKFEADIAALENLYKAKRLEAKKYLAIEDATEQMTEKGIRLEEQKNSLQLTLADMNCSVQSVKERLKVTTCLLETDEKYSSLTKVSEDLQRIIEENDLLEEELLSDKTSGEIERGLQEIDLLAKRCNDKLIKQITVKRK